jgi:hypothetical protein
VVVSTDSATGALGSETGAVGSEANATEAKVESAKVLPNKYRFFMLTPNSKKPQPAVRKLSSLLNDKFSL